MDYVMKENQVQFKYKSLVQEFTSKIRNGSFRPGDRLPSIRTLHKGLQLSVSTVYQAYSELEKTGLVEARPRSGYFVKPISVFEIPKAPRTDPRPVHVTLSSMVASTLTDNRDGEMVHLGTSTPAPELLPVKALARIMKSIKTDEMTHLLDYSLAEGDPELRRGISRLSLGVMDGVGPADIIVTQGSMEALTLSLRCVTRPGDVVAIDSPTHMGYLQLLQELGLMALEIPADPRYGTDVDNLAQVLAHRKVTAYLLVSNFQNPTGALMPEEQKKRLVELTHAHDIPVIEDNLFGELYFGRHRPLSLKKYDRKNLVISCSSFSKTVSPGLRVGWVVPGSRFYHKILALRTGTTIAASTLDQYLVMRFLKEGEYDRYMRKLRGAMKQQMDGIAGAIRRHFPPATRLAVPEGGSLLWVELDRKVDSLALFHAARKKKIAIAPGIFFSVTNHFNHFIRIGCGFPFTDRTESGIKTLGELMEPKKKR
jgi:DNA-binding transcriptional MocR family regulator